MDFPHILFQINNKKLKIVKKTKNLRCYYGSQKIIPASLRIYCEQGFVLNVGIMWGEIHVISVWTLSLM